MLRDEALGAAPRLNLMPLHVEHDGVYHHVAEEVIEGNGLDFALAVDLPETRFRFGRVRPTSLRVSLNAQSNAEMFGLSAMFACRYLKFVGSGSNV
jgi:hypothetical protein